MLSNSLAIGVPSTISFKPEEFQRANRLPACGGREGEFAVRVRGELLDTAWRVGAARQAR